MSPTQHSGPKLEAVSISIFCLPLTYKAALALHQNTNKADDGGGGAGVGSNTC